MADDKRWQVRRDDGYFWHDCIRDGGHRWWTTAGGGHVFRSREDAERVARDAGGYVVVMGEPEPWKCNPVDLVAAKVDDGGPAFPIHETGRSGHNPGQSLRDYFAAKVLVGYIASDAVEGASCEEVAEGCYRYADAMIHQRSQPSTFTPR